jgi:UDP-GlcNAc:undecaprenyl-phosphate GlcNAc-1-phosphate transferase
LPPEGRSLVALALASALVYSTTPIAIRVADRLKFYDRPVGYKAHLSPTPYLGGAAVVASFVLTAALLSRDHGLTLPLIGGALLMWAIGTWDDRRTVAPQLRVAIEVALAVLLWSAGLGWDLGMGSTLDLVVTAVWIVGVVNAFNLFDNMDGATPSMGTVAAAGLAVLGVALGDAWLAVAAAALCGACAGFLPHNIRSPARIFLGDGGSMPIGFAVAALTMIGVSDAATEWQSLAMGLLFVGVPALDTTLVMISRRRRGISVLTAGRDHLTHRARDRLRTARAVAVALGTAQAVTSAVAIAALKGGTSAIVAAVTVYAIGAGVVIAVLDSRWIPPETTSVTATDDSTPLRPSGRRRRSLALLALLPLGAALAISPYFRGYYDSSIWVPAGLVLVAVLSAGVIARPPRLDAPAVLVLGSLVMLALWSLCSALWADSVQQAFVEGNRYLFYAALVGVLLVLVRTEAAAIGLVAVIATVGAVSAVVTAVRMLGPSGAELFVAGRLDAPLGYINGQGCFHLLAFWCCLALAEQRRRPALAGIGLAAATLLGALVVLSQSRGLTLAAIVSAAVVFALVPGRLRRCAGLLVIVTALAVASGALLEVYESRGAASVSADAVSAAARQALLVSVAAGVIWALVAAATMRAPAVARRLRPVAVALVAAAAVGGVGLAIAERDAIGRSIDEHYTSFTQVGDDTPSVVTSSRLVSGAGNRYDYWRVAWTAWRDHPLLGVGAGNYDRPYFKLRATEEDVRQPHSIELQVLSELGFVGIIWLGVLFAGLALGARRLSRTARHSSGGAFLAVAGVGCAVTWLVDASVDWMHLLPGVTGVALCAAIGLLRGTSETRPVLPAVAAVRRPLTAVILITVALTLTGVSLSRQWFAEMFQSRAQAALATRPDEALRQADRALRLDPEAVRSYWVKSAALARFGEAEAAQAALREAARREPGNYVTWALLGDLALRLEQPALARSHYRRALSLNPRDADLRRRAGTQASGG